jgi:hypothetical protein
MKIWQSGLMRDPIKTARSKSRHRLSGVLKN